MPRHSYHIENFGCRATQADGAAIERELGVLGLNRVGADVADVVVLNTCTVTSSADSDARAAIRRVRRTNPNAKIVVTGCYAQRAPDEIAALDGVSAVVGNSHKNQVAEMASKLVTTNGNDTRAAVTELDDVENITNDVPPDMVTLGQLTGLENYPEARPTLIGDIFAHTQLLAAPVYEDAAPGVRTRPNLKVQDGCDNRCSFCIIPYVRGNSRSLPMNDVLRECEALAAAGHHEVVLSGINLGRWGRDLSSSQQFEDLLEALLAKTMIPRIRISSVEPMDWSDRLIALVASEERICKHAHVPLQSGSDKILRAMHRKYRPWHYAEKLRKIREAMPDAAIGADVMTGFPGETDELFEENHDFIARLPFTYLHVFTYSARPGTPAAAMKDQVPVHIARDRNKILRDLVAEKNREFREQFIGRDLEAVTLLSNDDGSTEALSNNFVKMRIQDKLENDRLIRVKIHALTQDGLAGVAV